MSTINWLRVKRPSGSLGAGVRSSPLIRQAMLKPSKTQQTKRGRPPSASAAKRQEILLDVALEEFLRRGFAGANLDHIAERCKISKMTIYRKVGDKEALFLLTADRAVENLKPGYEAAIEEGGTPPELIRRLVAVSLSDRGVHSFDLLRLAIAEARSFPAISNKILERTFDIVKPVAEYIQRAANPALSEAQAEIRALIIANLAIGGFLRFLGDAKPDADIWAREVEAVLLAGVFNGLGTSSPNA